MGVDSKVRLRQKLDVAQLLFSISMTRTFLRIWSELSGTKELYITEHNVQY